MDSICGRKYKDEVPLKTIKKIRNILNDLEIITVETGWQHSADSFYSVTVSVANTTLSTNGKGTTYEYALASAYGELMERLQNQAPYRLNNDVSQEALQYLNFFYAPDEKQMSLEELLNSEDEWIKGKLFSSLSEAIKRTLLEKWRCISYENLPCDFITVPFCNINSGKLSYIPIKMVSKMYMSNGMCAGNTPEEALVQGISEVLERYVNKRIISEGLTPPSIPKESIEKFPRINAMISQIELSGNCEVILKDCSLGMGLPVLGVIYINKDNQSYFVKFGAHPAFEIAAERTLTELLQGQDIRNMRDVWQFSYKSDIYDEHQNLINILAKGYGEYPNALFGFKAGYEFTPFADVSKMNNKEMLKYLVDKLVEMGYNVYARNVTFLGFPAYHVIVPGLSEIEEIDDLKAIRDYEAFIKVKKLLRNMEDVSDDKLLELAAYFENKGFGPDTNVPQLLNLPLNKSLPWYYVNVDLFLMAIYCKTGEFSKAASVLSRFLGCIGPSSLNSGMLTYYKCLRDYLCARADRVSKNEIFNLLGTFYPLQVVIGIIEEFVNSETIFKKYGLIKCFECKDCQLNIECLYKETERIFKIIKDKYAVNNIKQRDLINLLK